MSKNKNKFNKIPTGEDARTLKDRFNISADELENRMQLQRREHEEPVSKAVGLLEEALDKVLTSLGVNIALGDIPAQQDALGIMITEEDREEYAGINGFFIFVTRNHDLIPYAWVGAARLNSDGTCWCDIHWFNDDRLEETGGFKVVQ